MSYRPMVKVHGGWNGNSLRFETREEAEASAYALFVRWTLCEDHRAEESADPVNWRLIQQKDGTQELQRVTTEESNHDE